MLKIGIVGLPNVGKSTLFKALTANDILIANYPFATIEPNTGIVPVPDERLGVLAKMYDTEKIIPATVKFVDIAGLVAGASKGEGLGNKFLANIRECDAICHVVRAFESDDIQHVESSLDPKRDIEIINTELALADLESLEKYIPKLQKEMKSGNIEATKKYAEVAKALERTKESKAVEVEIEGLELLTAKPVIYMFNMDEVGLANEARKQELVALVTPAKAVFVAAKIEEEMSDMDAAERQEFLESYGIKEPGLEQLISAAYSTLGLQSFLTAGKKEVRAWTVKKGATAPEAAGVIHTDFQKGFIAAQVVKYEDLVRLGSEAATKAAGLIKTEGKDYVMQPDDVVEFRFNV